MCSSYQLKASSYLFAMLGAGRARQCCIQKCDSIVPKLSLVSPATESQQQQLQSCSRTDFRAGLSMYLVSTGHVASTPASTLGYWVFLPWQLSFPVRAKLKADQWALGNGNRDFLIDHLRCSDWLGHHHRGSRSSHRKRG